MTGIRHDAADAACCGRTPARAGKVAGAQKHPSSLLNMLLTMRLFFCHWRRKRKRLGKTPSRFKMKCCNSFIQPSYFSPALPPFKSEAIPFD
jgi:hypothetical protein